MVHAFTQSETSSAFSCLDAFRPLGTIRIENRNCSGLQGPQDMYDQSRADGLLRFVHSGSQMDREQSSTGR